MQAGGKSTRPQWPHSTRVGLNLRATTFSRLAAHRETYDTPCLPAKISQTNDIRENTAQNTLCKSKLLFVFLPILRIPREATGQLKS